MNNRPTTFNFIGEKTSIDGNIHLDGDTHIFGSVKGNITGDQNIKLTIDYTGQVEGNIHGLKVFIHGQLLGNVINAESIEATGTAKIKGSITAKKFLIYPGAKIDGEIQSIKIESNPSP